MLAVLQPDALNLLLQQVAAYMPKADMKTGSPMDASDASVTSPAGFSNAAASPEVPATSAAGPYGGAGESAADDELGAIMATAPPLSVAHHNAFGQAPAADNVDLDFQALLQEQLASFGY